MRLPVQLVESFEDDQLNFEALQDVLTSPGTGLPFLQLPASGQAAINWGTVSFVWSAAAASASKNVSHGLPRTPQAVLLQSATSTNFLASNVTAVGASTFTANGFTTTNTTLSGTFGFFWIAIG